MCSTKHKVNTYDEYLTRSRHAYWFDSEMNCFLVTDLPAPISVCPSRQVNPDLVGRISSPGFPVANPGVQLNCTLVLKIPLVKKLTLREDNILLNCK